MREYYNHLFLISALFCLLILQNGVYHQYSQNQLKIGFFLLFELVEYKNLKENWLHYSKIYNLGSKNFRNDHVFSIAIHIMNGFTESDWAKELPGTMYYTLDRDHVVSMDKDDMKFLVEKENYSGEYTLASTRKSNVHVMNKFSLERIIS